MDLGESDEDTWDITFSDEHIRAICANAVAEQLKDFKKEVDSESVATESKTIADSFKTNVGKCFSQCQRGLEELPRKLDKQIQDTLSTFAWTNYGGVDTKVGTHTKDIQELKDAVKQLQAELAVANRRPSKLVVFSSAFEREVDYSVIRFNAGKLVSKAKVQEALQPCLEVDAGFAAGWWSIECRDVLSRVFAARVVEGEGLAARRAAKALSMLRVDGQWRQFDIEARSGGGTTKLRASADKNPRTIKLEITGRKVKGLLTTFLGNSYRLFFGRERGWLSVGWDPLLKLDVFEGRTPTEVKWKVATINKLGLDKDRLAEAISSAAELDQEPQR
ncbi:unnamed protein product, partial [Prorocentrum cordatum]